LSGAGVRSKPGHGPGFVALVTVVDLGKLWCAILGLNQLAFGSGIGCPFAGCMPSPCRFPI
jgi:hypothetical protein